MTSHRVPIFDFFGAQFGVLLSPIVVILVMSITHVSPVVVILVMLITILTQLSKSQPDSTPVLPDWLCYCGGPRDQPSGTNNQ